MTSCYTSAPLHKQNAPHNDCIVLSRLFPVEYCYNVGSEFLSSLLLYSLLRAPPLRLKCKGYFCCDSKRAG